MHRILNKDKEKNFSYRLVLKKNINKKKNAGWILCNKNDFDPNEFEDIELVGSEWVNRSRTSVLMKISLEDKKARDDANEKRATEQEKENKENKKHKETIKDKLTK